MSTIILRTTARILTPLIVVMSVYLLLRGHNAPGGGFIAALVAGAAVALSRAARADQPRRARMRWMGFAVALGSGLLVATGTGLVALLLGATFLEGTIVEFAVPLLGEGKFATSLVFDIGVYLIVVGVITAIVDALGEDAW